MGKTNEFIAGFWANLDGWLVFFNIFSGILLGTFGGLLLVIWLQRRGWLTRVNRWHHLLLKLYFLAIPCLGGFVGLQAGMLYAAEKQIHREIDRQQPFVETITLPILTGFYSYISESADRYDLAKYASLSPREVLLLIADDFIESTPIQIYENPDQLSFQEHLVQRSLERSRRALLVWVVDDVLISEVLVRKGTEYTYLNTDTIKRITDVPIDTWFSARAVLDFTKTQVSRMWFSYYLAVAAQGLLVMMLISLEFALSIYFGQYQRCNQRSVNSSHVDSNTESLWNVWPKMYGKRRK